MVWMKNWKYWLRIMHAKKKTENKNMKMKNSWKWNEHNNGKRQVEVKKMKTFLIVVYVSQTDVFRKQRINWCNDDSGSDDNETKPNKKNINIVFSLSVCVCVFKWNAHGIGLFILSNTHVVHRAHILRSNLYEIIKSLRVN